MIHLLAYTVASAGGVTNQDTPGVQDNYATLQNNHYILPIPYYVKWLAAVGANITNARLNTPYLRQINLPSFGAIEAAAAPSSLPAIDWFDSPMMKLNAIDETACEITDSAGATQLFAFVGLMDQLNYNVPQGPISRIRFTSAITVGNKVWGAGSVTLDQPLPYGQYAITGMDVFGANLMAARLVFQGGGPRPGILARQAVGTKPDPNFMGGHLGVFGVFNSTAIPSLELIGSAAPTTQTGYWDVVKVG